MHAGGNPVLLICAVAALIALAVLVRVVKRDATGGKDSRGEGGLKPASGSTHTYARPSHLDEKDSTR